MQLKDVKETLEEILIDNGIIDGIKVSANINPQRDVLRLVEVVKTIYEWVDGAIKAERVARSRLLNAIRRIGDAVKSQYIHRRK